MIVDINNMIGTRKGYPVRTPEMLIEEMDAAGVDHAIVSCFSSNEENAMVLSAVQRYSDRLSGMYMANPYVERAAEEYQAAVEAGFCALRLDPLSHGYSAGNLPLLAPLLEICANYKTPVWIYSTADVYCTPILLQDIAETFPTVPVIIGYMGFNYEASSAVGMAQKYTNIYLDPTAAMNQNLKRAVNGAGAGKLMLGSGTPVASYFEIEIEKVRSVVSKETDLRRILGENAVELFRIGN